MKEQKCRRKNTLTNLHTCSLTYIQEIQILIKHDGEKSWKQQGVILNQCAPRSYNIQTAGGQVRPNRRYLKSFPSGNQHLQESTPDDTATDQPESLSETTQDPVSEAQPLQPPQVPPDSSSVRKVPDSTSCLMSIAHGEQ